MRSLRNKRGNLRGVLSCGEIGTGQKMSTGILFATKHPREPIRFLKTSDPLGQRATEDRANERSSFCASRGATIAETRNLSAGSAHLSC